MYKGTFEIREDKQSKQYLKGFSMYAPANVLNAAIEHLKYNVGCGVFEVTLDDNCSNIHVQQIAG